MAGKNWVPEGRITDLQKSIETNLAKLGVEGARVQWEQREESPDANVKHSGGFRISIGESGQNSHYVSVSELHLQGGSNIAPLIVSGKAVPSGMTIVSEPFESRGQNTYLEAVTGKDSIFRHKGTGFERAARGEVISGVELFGSALAGATKLGEGNLANREFHAELNSLLGFVPGYTGKGPAEGGAEYDAPAFYALAASESSLHRNIDREGAYGVKTFNTGVNRSLDGYVAGSYISQADFARSTGMRVNENGTFTFVGDPAKVVATGRRMNRERYDMLGNSIQTGNIKPVGVFERGTSSGRSIVFGLTRDATYGLTEGRAVGSTGLLSTPSLAKQGTFQSEIPITGTISPQSLKIDYSETNPNHTGPGALLKGGWKQPLATFDDGTTINLPTSGYGRRVINEVPRMWVGSQGKSVKQFTDAIFGDEGKQFELADGTVLHRDIAEYAISGNMLKPRYGLDLEKATKLRGEVLERVRSAWEQRTADPVVWGDWSRVEVGFENEPGRPRPQGGEGFHITTMDWGVRGMVASASFKSQSTKIVAGYQEGLSERLPGNMVLAGEKDVNKGLGWLDQRHQYWHVNSAVYRSWFEKKDRTAGEVEKQVSRLERGWRADFARQNPDLPKNFEYTPAIAPQGAAEWNAPGRMTAADLIRAEASGSMTKEELEHFSRGLVRTPVWGLLTALSKNSAVQDLKTFKPLTTEDVPDVVPQEKLTTIGSILKNEHGWDPNSDDKIRVNDLTIPSPEQVGMMGSNRQFMAQYTRLFSNAPLATRQAALESVEQQMMIQLASPETRADAMKAQTGAGIYTQYSASPDLVGKNAIEMGYAQIKELFQRSGGGEEGFNNLMRGVKSGDIVTQAFVGREPGQVALQRMNVIYNKNMPDWTVPNISPEFEMLSLGDSDGDPMKVFFIPNFVNRPTIDNNSLARRALGTMASLAGVDKATEYFSNPANQRSSTETEAQYLNRVLMGPNALNPAVGGKFQNVAVDRLNINPKDLKENTLTSGQVQTLIDKDTDAHGKMGIYNLVQTMRAGLNRDAVNAAYGGGRMSSYLGVTGESAYGSMRTALGAWYQIPLDIQKLPESMDRLYKSFNVSAYSDMAQNGKSISAQTTEHFRRMVEQQVPDIYRDKDGSKGLMRYQHSSEEIGALFGVDAENMRGITRTVDAERVGMATAELHPSAGGNSAIGRSLSVSAAIQFEEEMLKGNVKVENGKYYRSENTRSEDNGEYSLKWKEIDDETLASVAAGKADPLMNDARIIRRKMGTNAQYYGAAGNLQGVVGDVMSKLDLSGTNEQRTPVHAEVVDSGYRKPTAEDIAKGEAESVKTTAPRLTQEEFAKVKAPAVDQKVIDDVGKVSGNLLAVDTETVFVKDSKGQRQSVWALGFADESGATSVSYHPVGKFIEEEWKGRDKNTLENLTEGYAGLAGFKKIAKTTGDVALIESMDENKSGEEYRKRISALKEGDILVGHNIMQADNAWLGSGATKGKLIDTLEVERMLSGVSSGNDLGATLHRRAEGNASMQAVYEAHKGGAHTADVDAKATLSLFRDQVAEAAKLPEEVLRGLIGNSNFQAGPNEMAGGYSERQQAFFKAALEHKTANGITGTAAEQTRILGNIRTSGRYKGDWIAPPPVTGGSGGGSGSGSGGPPPTKPISGVEPEPEESSGRGFNMSKETMEALANQIGTSVGKEITDGRLPRMFQGIANTLNNILKGQASRMSQQWKPGVSGGRNALIEKTFGGGGSFATEQERVDAMKTYGGSMSRMDALVDEMNDPATSPSRLRQIAKSLDSMGTKVGEVTMMDEGTLTPSGRKAVMTMFGLSNTASSWADELDTGKGPRVEAREKFKAEAKKAREEVKERLSEGKYAEALAAGDPTTKHFEKTLESLTEKMKKFGESIDKSTDSVESKEDLKAQKTAILKDQARAAALIGMSPSDQRQSMVDLLRQTTDFTGARGGVLTEAQARRAEEIETIKPAKANRGIERLMGGMFLFQMARDWRMTMGPLVSGAAETVEDRTALAAQTGMFDQAFSGQGGGTYGAMKRFSGVEDGRKYAGYATMGGLASLVGGGRPDLLASNPLVQGIGSALSAGIGGAVGLGFAAQAMGGAGAAGSAMTVGGFLAAAALPVGATLATIAGLGYVSGYSGDAPSRAADSLITGNRQLLGTGYSERLAGSVRQQMDAGVPISKFQSPGAVPVGDLPLSTRYARGWQVWGDVLNGTPLPQAWSNMFKDEQIGTGEARAAGINYLAMDSNPQMGDIWDRTKMNFGERQKTMAMLMANGVDNTNPNFRNLTERIGYGQDPNVVMTNAQQIGEAMGTGSAFPAGVRNLYNRDKSEAGQMQFATNFKRLGGSNAIRSRLLAGQSLNLAVGIVGTIADDPRNLASMQVGKRAGPAPTPDAVDDMQSLAADQGSQLMEAGSLAGIDMGEWNRQFTTGGRNLSSGQFSLMSAFLAGDPTANAIFARDGKTLPGRSWRAGTRADIRNGGMPLFDQSLSGLTKAMDQQAGWEKQISGDTQPALMSNAFIRSQLESIPALEQLSRKRGISFTDEDISAMAGKTFEGKGGISGLQELYAQKSYQNQLAGVGLSYAESNLSRAFELNVNRPQKDLQLALSGASQFGGSVATPYGQYNATGSFNFQQQNMAFQWQGQQIQYGRQQVQFGWEQQSMDMSRAGQLQGRSMGLFDLSYQRRDLDLGHQYFQQDWQFGQQKRQLQFGWQMEDAERNIRRATGFEKQQLIRERGRAAEMFNLDSQQLNREKGREEDKYKREDERWRLQLANFQTMAALEDQRYDLEKEQLTARKKWAEEDFQREKTQHERDVKQFEESRTLAEINYKQDQARWAEEKKFGDDQFKLQQARIALQATEIENAERLRSLVDGLSTERATRLISDSQAMIENLENFFNTLFISMGAKVPFNRPPPDLNTTVTGPKAMGGSFEANSEFLAGEHGPELVKFDRPGYVIPATRTAAMREQSSSRMVENTPVYVTIDGKVVAEAVITHGGDALRRNTRRNLL